MNDERAVERALGRTWADDYPWAFLTRLTGIGNRMGGHPGERQAAGLVAEAFADAGVADVAIDGFEMQRWDRGRATLSVTDPVEREFRTIALPYSPAGEVAGDLVDVGYGTPEEIDAAGVEGAIAVASTTTPPDFGRFIHRMEKFGHAADAGAVGFVFHNHVPGQLPPTGALRFDEEAAMPGVGVSKETGAWLTEYADRGGRAELSVEAATESGESQNVHGTLGPDTDEEIVLLGHYDAHDVAEGALDNGCGIAIVVQAARILADLEIDTRVRVAGVGCEEIGLLGSEALARKLDLDSVRAVVNVDGAGRFRDLRAFTHASEAVGDVAESVADRVSQPVEIEDGPHPFSDHWPFLRAGVPALQLHSVTDDRGRGWGHTEADTHDKVDDRNLREHAMLAALLVRELAATDDLPGLPADHVADRLREDDYEEGMRAAGIWPEGW
jgi:Zn-dependent M28 family amino/carboxypeptidase